MLKQGKAPEQMIEKGRSPGPQAPLRPASGRPLHVVLAGPTAEGDAIIVTLYEPDLERFEPGFARRKPKP
jgi:hypothetical protein